MAEPGKQVALKTDSIPALALSETELMNVLSNSLYPGAKTESIKLVIGYCKASNLDPMQKPVHIVPMSVKGEGGYQMRDVIMPGIGLYRTQAARSNEYGGISEPEFGDEVSNDSEVGIPYPKWCKVTVKRIVGGTVVEFSAKEFWKENYATKSRDTTKPNAMWERRPYAQLAKCAEAQALRKAFPEVGSQPTYDEMDGKTIDDVPAATPAEQRPAKELPKCTKERFAEMCIDVVNNDSGEVEKMGWKSLVQSGSKTAEHLINMLQTKYSFSEDQLATIRSWEKK